MVDSSIHCQQARLQCFSNSHVVSAIRLLLRIRYHGPGLVKISGKGVETVERRVAAGTSYLPITPSTATTEALKQKGRVRVSVAVQFTPDGSRAYVTRSDDGDRTLVALDPATGAVLGSIPIEANGGRLRFSPDGGRAYLTVGGPDGAVTVIDTNDGRVVATIDDLARTKYASQARFTPDGRYAYFLTGDRADEQRLVFVSTVDDTVTTVGIAVEGRPSFSDDGRYMYVDDWRRGRIVIIDLGDGLSGEADGGDAESAA